ncbi:MAG: SH3 domain-containing protein [Oscillospiraceae bacterium]|nr:SH3 domain-containing protein [Oscillospiraceae bacterium]MCL2279501.1 SH3 domain-containing protein [Oscillospiraceae bacterium]
MKRKIFASILTFMMIFSIVASFPTSVANANNALEEDIHTGAEPMSPTILISLATASGVNIRDLPNTNSRSHGQLQAGEAVTVIAWAFNNDGGFARVRVYGRPVGNRNVYVSRQFLTTPQTIWLQSLPVEYS